MPHEAVQKVLDELAVLTGLDSLPLDGNGRLTLTFDNKVEVTLEHETDDGHLLIWSVLAELGDQRPPKLMEELLDADFLGQGTGGATLAVEHRTGKVVLWQTLPATDMTAPTLERVMQAFVAAATHWTFYIATGGDKGAPSGIPESFHHHHHVWRA